MPCNQKQTQTTRKRDKDGDTITTHTSKRVCANDPEKVQEAEEEEEEADLLLVKPGEAVDDAALDEQVLTEAQIKTIFSRFMKRL